MPALLEASLPSPHRRLFTDPNLTQALVVDYFALGRSFALFGPCRVGLCESSLPVHPWRLRAHLTVNLGSLIALATGGMSMIRRRRVLNLKVIAAAVLVAGCTIAPSLQRQHALAASSLAGPHQPLCSTTAASQLFYFYDSGHRDVGAAQVRTNGCGSWWTIIWSHLSTQAHVFANIASDITNPQSCDAYPSSPNNGCQTGSIGDYTTADGGMAYAVIDDPYTGQPCQVWFHATSFNATGYSPC